MVPKGWKTCTVEQLFDVQLGKMLNQTAKELHPQHPYLGNTNVKWGSFEISNLNTMFFSEKEKEKFTLLNGDIVMCEGGEVGRCAIWRDDKKDIYFQKALHRLRSKGKVHPEYFQNFMHHIAGTKLLEDLTTRTSISHLTREKLLKLPISLPPLHEQTKIAQILSTWDKAIATTERLLANNRQQKQALMQQLLTGQKRFAGFTETWKDFHLSDVTEIIVSPVDKKTEPNEIPVELCNYTDVYYNNCITRKINFMRATATQSEIERFTLQIGDVVITKDSETPGDIAVPALVSEDLGGVVCGYHLAIIRCDQKNACGEYMNHLFAMPKTRYYFFTLATGATRFGLSVGGIHNAHFNLPSLVEQQKIAQVLSTADAEISNLQAQLAKLKLEKKALMQQLLTGQRRVKPDADAAA